MLKGRAPAIIGVVFAAIALGPFAGWGCGSDVPNPYATSSSSGFPQGAGGGGGGTPIDPELGGPCVDDTQCNDGIDCTFDACDHTVARCRFVHDDSLCQNTVFCDGIERCDQKLGCIPGAPHDCGDGNVCTIETCIESSQSCDSVPRDADGDGDPDIHCGGGDCADFDPTVSSLDPEICGNGIDDNCVGGVDEDGCITPAHDTCTDALVITASGHYTVDTSGAAFDYATTCAPMGTPLRDVVAAIQLPAGPPVDVIVTARASAFPVAVTVAGQCGAAGSEISCSTNYTAVNGNQIAKTRARGLGDAFTATAYPLYVTTVNGTSVGLDVQIVPAEAPPQNETCGTAEVLTPDVAAVAELVDVLPDLDSACPHPVGELVYQFTLAETSDIDLYAASIDGNGQPSISLRDTACALIDDEVTCDVNLSPHVFRHSLGPGTFYVSVSATAPTDVSLDLVVSPPTAPDPDETCATAPPLTPNVTHDVVMANHQDDETFACLVGAVDAAYSLDLSAPSDVLLVLRTPAGDSAAVELAGPSCDDASLLACGPGTRSPVRATKRNVAAGNYRVVAESSLGQDEQVTAFVRPTAPATIVAFSDACADAITIPETGGFFQGNTGNAVADFSAGCDNAGGPANGAKDQMLELTLTAHKRVVLDTNGSGYNTLLDLRSGSTCPGSEINDGCTVSIGASKAFLDLELDPGTYWVQVDGLGTDTGPWFLNVYVVDP